MSLMKSIEKSFGDLIFAISLTILVFLLSFSQFIKYENIQPLLMNVFEKQVKDSISTQQLDILHQNLTQTCRQTNVEFATVPLQEEELRVNCSEIEGKQSSELVGIISKSYFDSIYKKKYDCNFLDCIRNGDGPKKYMVILSEKAYEEAKKLSNYMIVVMAFGLFLLAVSIRTWHGVLKNIGISGLFVGISYFTIPFFRGYVNQQIPSEASSTLAPIVDNFISILQSNFVVVLVVGIIFSVVGLSYGFYLKRKSKKS